MNRQSKFILIFSLVSAGFFSLFASSAPDGLEYVAEIYGFISSANNFFSGIFSEYSFPIFESQILGSSLAGLLGVVSVFVFVNLFLFFIYYFQVIFNKSRD